MHFCHQEEKEYENVFSKIQLCWAVIKQWGSVAKLKV